MSDRYDHDQFDFMPILIRASICTKHSVRVVDDDSVSLIGSTHACIETKYVRNLVWLRSLLVIVVLTSAANRVPFAKNMLSSNQEDSTLPKVINKTTW